MGTVFPGIIELCSKAFFDEWKGGLGSGSQPWDDRQYNVRQTGFLVEKQTFQAQGMQ